MKKILLATSALAATSGFASAQGGEGGLTVSGSASMGLLGGGWIVDKGPAQGIGKNQCGMDVHRFTYTECPIPGQSKYELHTDIDIAFTMTGQTDTGLTFGASVDLDESDGEDDVGNSAAFDGRTQGGEEIYISGAFGTLTMGDTDGALDWAMQEIGIGSSLGDAHTSHAGYNGNGFADGFGGQILRYDHSFGDFAVAVSANLSDEAAHEDVLAVGAKFNALIAATELGFGVGYSQLGYDGEHDDALGVSVDAKFKNGFRAILNWVDLGDSPHAGDNTQGRLPFVGSDGRVIFPGEENGEPEYDAEQYMGIGLGYTMDEWTFTVNYGQYSEDLSRTTHDPGQSGFAVAVNYDLGRSAELQLGYSKSTCELQSEQTVPSGPGRTTTLYTGGSVYHGACGTDGENSALSLGVVMNF